MKRSKTSLVPRPPEPTRVEAARTEAARIEVTRTRSPLPSESADRRESAVLERADSLFTMPGRRECLERLRTATSESTSRVGCVVRIDLHGISRVNQVAGHDEGDLLLTHALGRLREAARATGARLYRVGGNQFCLVLEGLARHPKSDVALAYASEVGARIVEGIQLPFRLTRSAHRIRCTVGMALFGGAPVTVEQVLRHAEIARDEAGRSPTGIAHFDAAMLTRTESQSRLMEDLLGAIGTPGLHLVYQPVVEWPGRVIGAEALLRWVHPDRGPIPPLDFIPLAEQSGLVIEVGRAVRKMAVEQLMAWQGAPSTKHLRVAVNVSPVEFLSPEFGDDVADLVCETGVDPKGIQLEVTEGLALENVERVREVMERLGRLGITFAVDDFGTGFTSVSYLKRLPFDRVKIDRSFVRDILVNTTDASLAHAIVAMAESLGLEAVAEGVEDESQVRMLREMGCFRFQGYYFARPGPAAATTELTERSASPGRSAPPASSGEAPASHIDRAALLFVELKAERRLSTSGLVRSFYDVEVVSTFADAVRAARRKRPDVLVLDTLAPGSLEESSWQLLRGAPELESVPVVFLSPPFDTLADARALDLGAAAVLSKPVSAAALRLAVTNQLELARKDWLLQHQATLDSATGVANRRSLQRALHREVGRTRRLRGALSVLVVDLDDFREFCRVAGPALEGAALRSIAQTLSASLEHTTDLVGRLGKDRFAVLLPLMAREEAERTARYLLERISTLDFSSPEHPHLKVTASIGVATMTDATSEADENALIVTAERALSSAKDSGKNSVAFA